MNSMAGASTEQNAKEAEKALYNRIYAEGNFFCNSDIREGLLSASELSFREKIRRLVPGRRVLEIGCGLGDHAIFAASCGAKEVVGTDVAENAIKAATARLDLNESAHAHVSFKVMDVEKLDFPDHSFDVVINHEVFSSVKLQPALSEIKRVLTPGGVLLGIECLGHNPVFNLNRRIGVLRKRRSAWAAKHIVVSRDLALITRIVGPVQVQYFHLCIFALAPFFSRLAPARRQNIKELLDHADERLLGGRVVRNLAFKVVFESCANP